MNGTEDKPVGHYGGRGAARLPIYLSALVFPGAGQFAQKRWLAGAFFAVLFSIVAAILLATIFVPLYWNLRVLAETAGADKMPVWRPAPYVKIFVWFGVLLAVYAAGLLDTVRYNRRGIK